MQVDLANDNQILHSGRKRPVKLVVSCVVPRCQTLKHAVDYFFLNDSVRQDMVAFTAGGLSQPI